ncbi:MAG TPA: bifunctional 5,10-methylenetetrahydrofolate dehydrogenase/5,10-methenyltetrahydrofolate cyclohydrolase [Gaiellaceae bacterium]|nr:bifunctional 5,10-methylenetetrahydrofolate dehydrogenase/5,10-methenyltetrahydrofolate cyclohydrolase [Gaiellaceae bacterium]
MAATLMDGKALAAKVREEVAREVGEVGSLGLATILVGNDPASEVYIRLKHTDAEQVGIRPIDERLPDDAAEEDVLALIRRLNEDAGVDGVIVQTPLPSNLDEHKLLAAVDPMKDVDGLTPHNAGLLLIGRRRHVGATPLGIMALLDEYRIRTSGARAVVVGRSMIVGKPVSLLLLQANATLTICHTRTEDLQRHTLDADILVAAVGVPGLITSEMVKVGATVIDVGITRTPAGLIGDVDPSVAGVAGHLTPVPGGVGPMTRAMVLENTVLAAKYRRGLLPFW